MAGRTLDDTSTDRSKILSKNIVDIASKDENWAKTIESLPDTILEAIENKNIEQIIKSTSIEKRLKAYLIQYWRLSKIKISSKL